MLWLVFWVRVCELVCVEVGCWRCLIWLLELLWLVLLMKWGWMLFDFWCDCFWFSLFIFKFFVLELWWWLKRWVLEFLKWWGRILMKVSEISLWWLFCFSFVCYFVLVWVSDLVSMRLLRRLVKVVLVLFIVVLIFLFVVM